MFRARSRAGISFAAAAASRAFRARRQHGHSRACGRTEDGREMGPSRRRRQSPRRRGPRRLRDCRTRGGRWTHAPRGVDGRGCGESEPLPEAPVRRDARFRPAHARDDFAAAPGQASLARAANGEGADRVREGASARRGVRVGRRRKPAAPLRRALQGPHRSRPRARPLQRRRTCDARAPRRTGGTRVSSAWVRSCPTSKREGSTRWRSRPRNVRRSCRRSRRCSKKA